jgi:outer membrane protein TolC
LFSAKVGVTQPLLRGAGKDVTLAAYHQAQAQETASERERDRAATTLAHDVLVAYWELWYASKAVEVDAAARETAKAQRDDAVLRARTGSLAPADVLTFETQLSTKEESLIQSELDRSTRQNDLGRLLGRDRAPGDLAVSEAEPPAAKDLPGELVNRALQGSPDVAVNEANVTTAEVQARTAADPYRPRLDLDAYVQAQGLGNKNVPNALSQLTTGGVLSAHVGLTLELPLKKTRYRGESERAQATVAAARDNLGATRNQVAADVTTLAQQRELARRRIELASVSSHYAEQQLAAERALFTTGSATALEVTQAADNVQAANKRLARARADVIQADLGVAYHLGTLLKDAISR